MQVPSALNLGRYCVLVLLLDYRLVARVLRIMVLEVDINILIPPPAPLDLAWDFTSAFLCRASSMQAIPMPPVAEYVRTACKAELFARIVTHDSVSRLVYLVFLQTCQVIQSVER